MTTLPNRPNTALLIVDMQNDVVKAAHARDAVIANVARLVDKARRKDVAVVWALQCDDKLRRGSDGWKLAPPLGTLDHEPVIEKEDKKVEAARRADGSGGEKKLGGDSLWSCQVVPDSGSCNRQIGVRFPNRLPPRQRKRAVPAKRARSRTEASHQGRAVAWTPLMEGGRPLC